MVGVRRGASTYPPCRVDHRSAEMEARFHYLLVPTNSVEAFERRIAGLRTVAEARGWTVVLAALQIVLRYGFDSGIAWADPLLRVLVLWLGLLGALAATRDRRHITIDVLSRMLPARAKAAADAATSRVLGARRCRS